MNEPLLNAIVAAQDCASDVYRLEAEHRSRSAFDGTVILFDPIV
jgi:hypothetical protein